ncbi:MAG: hypothetical protein ABI686_10355 [Acidobacteriota bacterium]
MNTKISATNAPKHFLRCSGKAFIIIPTLQATTPGQFVVPPAKAEEMYHPETFGRTGMDFVKIE